jgi:hypothetical protein
LTMKELNSSGLRFPVAPVSAVFPSMEAARTVFHRLVAAGFSEEQIALARAQDVLPSVANDPVTYRADDMAHSRQMEEDAAPEIVGEHDHDAERAADLDHFRPGHGVMLSVSVEDEHQAARARDVLSTGGGQLRPCAVPRGGSDHGEDDPGENTRAA